MCLYLKNLELDLEQPWPSKSNYEKLQQYLQYIISERMFIKREYW